MPWHGSRVKCLGRKVTSGGVSVEFERTAQPACGQSRRGPGASRVIDEGRGRITNHYL